MYMPALTTERLLIRPFVLSDLDAIHLILDVESGDVVPEDTARRTAAKAERRQWLEWSVLNYTALERLHQPPYGDRAIVLRMSGEVIGACGFAPVMLPFAQLPAFRPADASPSQPARNTNELVHVGASEPMASCHVFRATWRDGTRSTQHEHHWAI